MGCNLARGRAWDDTTECQLGWECAIGFAATLHVPGLRGHQRVALGY